jgi:hypothetical protein
MKQDGMHSKFAAVAIVLPAILLVGCGDNRGRALPPKYNPQAGAEAMQAYDKNKDGFLSGDELKRVPALLASLGQVDTDNDKKVSAKEIDDRVRAWQETKIAEVSVRCHVTLDGQPLSDVQVVFDPEPFLGPEVPQATGTTNASGTTGMSMPTEKLADPKYGGVACGWYKIRVTSASRKFPAHYNSETTLGCEVAVNASWVSSGEVKVELTSQ